MVEKVAVTQELLPCPFCGYEARWEGLGQWRVICTSVTCGAIGPAMGFQSHARFAWNDRVPDEATRIATAEACARIADAEWGKYTLKNEENGGFLLDRLRAGVARTIATAIRLQQGSEKP